MLRSFPGTRVSSATCQSCLSGQVSSSLSLISLSLKGRVTFLVHRAVWKTKQSPLSRHSVDDSWISEWKEMVTRKRCQDACGCGSGRTGEWWRVGCGE